VIVLLPCVFVLSCYVPFLLWKSGLNVRIKRSMRIMFGGKYMVGGLKRSIRFGVAAPQGPYFFAECPDG
jgi:hypothetical protein